MCRNPLKPSLAAMQVSPSQPCAITFSAVVECKNVRRSLKIIVSIVTTPPQSHRTFLYEISSAIVCPKLSEVLNMDTKVGEI